MTEELTEKDYEVLDACCELQSIKIAELKAENDRLKAEIKEVKKYQYQQEYLDKEIAELKAYKDVNEDFKTAWEELKAENERLKEENKLIRQLHKDLSDKLFEFQKIEDALQEIKAIAKRNIFLSPKLLEINGDIGQIQNIAITQILDLITKTEEE